VFTGIVQGRGRIVEIGPTALVLEVPQRVWDDSIQLGESIAVNGCCLTVAQKNASTDGAAEASGMRLRFDLSEETWRRTAFSSLSGGSIVNLERSLRPMDRMGGHIVQGHVDGVGELVSRVGEVFRFRVPSEGSPYLIEKGSIALDGISLTVVSLAENAFDVHVIPHTLAETNLSELQPGNQVNVEFDMVAKYLERLVER